MPEAGQPAPAFCLLDADMQCVDFADLRGKSIVLYFYPRDGTPSCTQEAIEFSDLEAEFARCNCLVFGVSRDDCSRHAEFRDKHGLAVTLLSDPDAETCRAYGVWQEREVDGVLRRGIVRATFVIDRKGIVRHALHAVAPRGHAAEVLKLIRQLDVESGHAPDRTEHRRHAGLPGA